MAPVLKWVGGKQKLLPRIEQSIEGVQFDSYFEPFIGGGSVLEHMLKSGKCTPGKVHACDNNGVLVNLHQAIKDDPDTIIDEVARLLEDQSEQRFYEIRTEYNHQRDPARFVYINKTGFNGLYRENKSGACNVPFGHGQRVKFVAADYTNLSELYKRFDVQFKTCDWTECLEKVGTHDFVYADPPYAPLTATANFTAYTKSGFGPDSTAALLTRAMELARSGTKVLLSNHDVPEVTDALTGFTFDRFTKCRSVSCKGSNKAAEILARNW